MQIHSLRKYDLGTNIISLDLKGKKTPQISSKVTFCTIHFQGEWISKRMNKGSDMRSHQQPYAYKNTLSNIVIKDKITFIFSKS